METISSQILSLARQVLVAMPPVCFVIGTILIIKGLVRFGQANSRAHGGRGAISYIITGACIMNSRLVMSVIINTLKAAGLNLPDIF